jgi:hypothetical protein
MPDEQGVERTMMRQRLPLLAALAAVLILCQPAAAQSGSQAPSGQPASAPVYVPTSLVPEPGLPRTPDGHPSFEGIWTTNFFPMIESTPLTPDLILTEDKAKAVLAQFVKMFSASPSIMIDPEAHVLLLETDGFPIVRGQRRARAVVLPPDGKLPFTPEARQEAEAYDMTAGYGLNNPEERPTGERCLTSGGQPPIASTLSLNPRQFIQMPGQIVIHTEYGDEARIIPFADHHGPKILSSRLGDSIARWEGDTLVIETTNLPAEDRVRPFPTLMVRPEATVIERYTRLSRDELLYQYTVIDPGVYTAPWLAEYSLYRTSQRMFPWSCHEGNYSLPNILKAQRVADARAQPHR